MEANLHCGQPLCKAAVAVSSGVGWPLRCASCGTALYPADVLARLPPNELEPSRAELMTERGGRRVPAQSKDLEPRDDATPDVDRILAMVDVHPGAAQRRARFPWLVAAALLVVATAAALLTLR